MSHILVVEDDKAILDLVRYILETDGHRVRTAEDGREALDMVRKEIPDLVLLDVMLPEIHGYEVCHRLKTSGATAGVKVLFLSAKTFPADRHQAMGVGADGFLSKPVEPNVLRERVADLLSSKS